MYVRAATYTRKFFAQVLVLIWVFCVFFTWSLFLDYILYIPPSDAWHIRDKLYAKTPKKWLCAQPCGAQNSTSSWKDDHVNTGVPERLSRHRPSCTFTRTCTLYYYVEPLTGLSVVSVPDVHVSRGRPLGPSAFTLLRPYVCMCVRVCTMICCRGRDIVRCYFVRAGCLLSAWLVRAYGITN